MILATVAALWLAVFMGRPAIARARFSRDVSRLRDEVADAVLDGAISDSDEAEAFVDRTTRVLDSPRDFTITYALALVSSARKAGIDMEKVAVPFKYEDLSTEDAEFMEQMDRRMVSVLSRHLVDGSCAWFILAPVRAVLVRLARVLGAGSASPVGSVTQIARETWSVDLRPSRHRTA